MADKTEKEKPVAESDDDYEPYKERKPKHPTNDLESMVHIVKAILGTGIVAMPEGFKNSGLLLGTVGSVINGGLLTYGVHILVKCTYVLCKRNRIAVLTYPEAMEMGFAQGPQWARKFSRAAGKIADGFIIFYQVGVCCVYTLFVVVNLKSVGDIFFKHGLAIQVYLLMMVIPLLLINSFRNLKVLVPFSFLANAITLMVIGVVFYFIFETELPPISERPLIAENLRRFPLFFGTTCFAFQSVAVVIAIENNMKTPAHFGGWFGIYNISLAVILVLYLAVGFCGYWRFGEDTESSITLNLPPKSVLTQVVNLLYAFSIYTSFGLNGQVPLQLVWDTYLIERLADSNWKVAWEYLLRVGTVTLSLFFAASIPMLSLFMSIFGAVALSHMTFIFPGVLDLVVRYPSDYGRFQCRKWRDIFLIVYGYIGLLTGCYVGITEIVAEYGKEKK